MIRPGALGDALRLGILAACGTGLLAAAWQVAAPLIAEREARARLAQVVELLSGEDYDNDLLRDTLTLPADPLLGTREPQTAYLAKRHGVLVATILQCVAPDGYGGPIVLVLAVRPDGRLMGVRVVHHQETPGWGDYIELGRSPWIHVFDGMSLKVPRDAAWHVRPDGGPIDAVSHATVSPRAVVKAVHDALTFLQRDTPGAPSAKASPP